MTGQDLPASSRITEPFQSNVYSFKFTHLVMSFKMEVFAVPSDRQQQEPCQFYRV